MKNRNLVLALIASVTILMAANLVTAAESSELIANNWYQEAERNYNNQDCINANIAAEKALVLYSKDGNSEGVLKTNDLIGKISACLKNLGDNFYGQALTNYTQQKYTDAITWAEKARRQYEAIPDNLSVAKCNKIITDSNYQLYLIQKARADSLFLTARKLYDNKDYLNARSNANQALEIYTALGDASGVEVSNALISAIDNDKFVIKELADSQLRQATELYARALANERFDDYVTAKKTALKSQTGYSKINDTQGYASAQDVIDGVNRQISMLEFKFKQLAEEDFNEASKLFLLGKASRDDSQKAVYYQNAITAYTNASDKYVQLIEWTMEVHDGAKNILYNNLLRESNARKNEVQQLLEDMASSSKAEDLYKEANTLYSQGECRNATVKANLSRTMFVKISNQAGMFKAETLLYQIDECLKKLSTAESFLANATADYGVAEYKGAMSKTVAAIDIYNQVKYIIGNRTATEFQAKITKAAELKKQADDKMNLSEIRLGERKYGEARTLVTEAETIYKNINYSAGVKAAQAIKDRITTAEKIEADNSLWSMLITGGALFLAIVVVAVSSYVKKTQMQKKENEEKLKEERAKAEAEAALRRAEREKEKAQQRELEAERLRLKAMIADEIQKMGSEKKDDAGQ